ncbi:MAG: hypothetical protein J7K88_00030, partial [Candidatus Fermentibacteraceae bacterium]|nr:hypothetical protein [Candidatus Fermentibacteraceae bacterium]
SLVEEIGLASEQVKMLVTSRTRLNIVGEFVYELSGMTIPEEDTPELLFSSPPVRLFLSNPDVDGKLDLDDLKTVVQICRSVNGVPLGIVLASSWLIEMTPPEILRRISETEDLLNRETAHRERRHSSLRRVFDYSWMLLSREERILFAELSVFRGGFSEEAVEFVTGKSGKILQGLRNKSLLQIDAKGTYSLHQLLHTFSTSKLEPRTTRKKTLVVRHAEYFCGLLKNNEKALLREDSSEAMEEITKSLSEIRAAVAVAVELKLVEAFLAASNSLRHYLIRTGFLEEGLEIFRKASVMLKSSYPEDSLQMMINQADFAIEMTMYEEAAVLLETVLAKGGKDTFGSAAVSSGVVYIRTGNFVRAENRMNSALSFARKSGDKKLEARALGGLGDLFNHKLEPAKAVYFAKQAVEVNRELGDIRGLFSNFVTLSNIVVNHGTGDSPLKYAQNALECAELLEGDLYIALGHISVSEAYEYQRELNKALEHAVKSVNLFEKIDSRWGLQSSLRTLASVQFSLGMVEESIAAIDRSIRISEVIGRTYNSMETFVTGGEIYEKTGNTDTALDLYSTARKIAGHLNIEKILRELDDKIAALKH